MRFYPVSRPCILNRSVGDGVIVAATGSTYNTSVRQHHLTSSPDSASSQIVLADFRGRFLKDPIPSMPRR